MRGLKLERVQNVKYVIWGTGQIAKEYMNQCKDNIEYFIDSDISKKRTFFYGKEVVLPSDIHNWNGIHVIIAVNASSEIERYLVSRGLNRANYSFYYEYFVENNFSNIEETIKEAIEYLQLMKMWKNKNICFGAAIANVEAISNYFSGWEDAWKETEYIYALNSTCRQDIRLRQDKVIQIPTIFSEYIYSRSSNVCNLKADVVRFVSEHDELLRAAKGFRRKHFDAQPLHEYGVIYYFYVYIKEMLKVITPNFVIVWNSFSSYHRVIKYVCRECNIPLIYGEHGVLPGTITFETVGEMGESSVTILADEFTKLPVSHEELRDAKKIWTYIKDNNLNRKVQWKSVQLKEIESRIKNGQPTIFMAGQNDVASGIYPYDEFAQRYHSPIFESSVQAAVYVAKICKQNDWNFIFKPHPYFPMLEEEMQEICENVILANEVGVNYLIDLADVTMTIVSQTAYMSLLRDKPALLLGYMQLKDKGCTYQAFEKNEIENVMQVAVKCGFTLEQRTAFQKHIAQVIKYYLYDDFSNHTYRYGRDYPTSLKEIRWLDCRLEEMEG